MKKRFTRYLVLTTALLAGSCSSLLARDTPIEAFIAREREVGNFVPVNNIWQQEKGYDKTKMLTKVTKGQALTIDYNVLSSFINQKVRDIQLEIPKEGGGSYVIDMARYDFFTSDFKVEVAGQNGSSFYNYTPGVYYRGVVDGVPGSVAAFSFFNNEVYGIFSTPEDGNIVVAPNALEGKMYDHNQHYVLYNDKDLLLKGPGCSTDDLPAITRSANKTTTNVTNEVYTNCKEIKVYELADFGMYQDKGSSVANVTNYLTALFNNQSTLYKNESVLTSLNYITIDNTVDSYNSLPTTNSETWLTAFADATQNNLHNSDLGIMYTTLGGGMGGVAWIQALCYPYQGWGPYAFCNIDNDAVTNYPTFSWDVEVSTHEMGHVVGSPHTHACVWNPPGTGTTAIDGCYTLEGGCNIPNPQYPTNGGTIMSYCHLTQDGINFTHGFGTQPGDTIRHFIAQQQNAIEGCGLIYNPAVALALTNHSLNANRECLDPTSGITYYWNDHNTAAQTDDTLVLMIKKNGNNIGTLDNAGFSVKTATIASYGTGSGDTATFPANTPYMTAHNITMRRYWSMVATTQPTSAVEVMYPFLSVDTADVHGSIPPSQMPHLGISNYLFYVTKNAISPNPALNFSGAAASDLSVYTYGDTASTTNWTMSAVGNTLLAHMKTTALRGGGSGVVSYWPLGVAQANTGNNITVYPNPAHDEWYVSVAQSAAGMTLHLYGADGKIVQVQALEAGKTNTVNMSKLPVGIYFYRIYSSSDVYTGNIVKK